MCEKTHSKEKNTGKKKPVKNRIKIMHTGGLKLNLFERFAAMRIKQTFYHKIV